MRIRCLSIILCWHFFFENNSIRWNFVRIFGVIKHYRSVVSHTLADTALSEMTQSKVSEIMPFASDIEGLCIFFS